jgi:hypothetical protein
MFGATGMSFDALPDRSMDGFRQALAIACAILMCRQAPGAALELLWRSHPPEADCAADS